MRIVTTQDVMTRIRAEFVEMPGMRLTARQVERLCGIDRFVCRCLLDTLVDVNFLRLTGDGLYARANDSRGHRRLAKAELPTTTAQDSAPTLITTHRRRRLEQCS
jgi:hypothetical protein